MTKDQSNQKLEALIELYKSLTPEHQKLFKEFSNEYQKKVDDLEEACQHLRSQLIKIRNSPY